MPKRACETVSTPKVKGPRVWLAMDQQEIDNASDQTVWAPNREVVLTRHRAASAPTSSAPAPTTPTYASGSACYPPPAR